MTMQHANYNPVLKNEVLTPGREIGPLAVDRGWTAFTHPIERGALQASSALPRPQRAFRPVDDASSWKAAELALAEIARANRMDVPDAGRDPAKLQRAAAAVRDSLLEAANAAAVAARHAQALAETLDEAIAVLAGTHRAQPALAPAGVVDLPPGTVPLSQREREVLEQVAEGRSNKAIAAALYVSPNTVKSHVASLLRKMNVDTRAQLAAMAVRQGLR